MVMSSPQAKNEGPQRPHSDRNTRTGCRDESAEPRRAPKGTAASPQGGPTRAPPSSTGIASVLGFFVAVGVAGAVAWASGCRSESPPGASTDLPSRVSRLPAPAALPSMSSAAAGLTATAGARAAEAPASSSEVTEKPYAGPLLGATALQTPVYPTMEFSKKRLGYIRHGDKVPVDPTAVKSATCSQGWYHLLDGGYVCGKYASSDMKNPQVRLGVTAPNLDDILPYKYAYNTAHGTPLYRSVPSKEDMIRYEPYLEMSKKARHKKNGASDTEEAPPESPPSAPAPTPSAAAPAEEAGSADKASAVTAAIGIFDGGLPLAEEAAPPPPKVWWQPKTVR